MHLIDGGGIEDEGMAHSDLLAARVGDCGKPGHVRCERRVRIQEGSVVEVVVNRKIAQVLAVQVNLYSKLVVFHIRFLSGRGKERSSARISRWRGDELQRFHRNRRPCGLRDKWPRRSRKHATRRRIRRGAAAKPVLLVR